jgi:hypothetical protein
VNYRGSSIVSGESRNNLAGIVRAVVGYSDAPSAGDRAPDVALAGPDAGCLYDVLRHPDHTLLAFAGEKPSVETLRHLTEIVDDIADGSYGDLVRGHAVVARTDPTPEHLGAGVLVRDLDGAAHARYGMREAGLCLIRPDRYVALRTRTLDAEGLHRCLRMVFSYKQQAQAGVG